MRYILTILISTALLSCKAQVERANYINKVKSICPDADIIEVETKDDYVEIEYLCDKKIIEVGLNFDLEIIYTESETSINAQTLNKIYKKLDKKYFGWTIDEFALIEMKDTSFYKVEILRDGIEENIYFTLEGKYYKTKNIVLNEPWNIASLEQNDNYQNSKYRLTLPNKTFEMPDMLVEISGIAVLNDTNLFCIQDEDGIIFRYNMDKEELTDMYRFTDVGDFEDITVSNKSLQVLRSDGSVFSIEYEGYNGTSNRRILPLNCMNIEGLHYDNNTNSYLIACKSQTINKANSLRHIYRVNNIATGSPEIVLEIDLEEINNFIHNQYSETKSKTMRFNPSAISVHPITGETYILSASNRLLAIYDNNKLKNVFPLAEELFYKPEGIAFNRNGDMFISTEGNKKGYVGGQVHYFKMQ